MKQAVYDVGSARYTCHIKCSHEETDPLHPGEADEGEGREGNGGSSKRHNILWGKGNRIFRGFERCQAADNLPSSTDTLEGSGVYRQRKGCECENSSK